MFYTNESFVTKVNDEYVYHVALVVENEPNYKPIGEFKSVSEAREFADIRNQANGFNYSEVLDIVWSSMKISKYVND